MKVLFIAIGIIILIAAIIALRVFFGLGHPGNAAPYALRRQLPRDNSPHFLRVFLRRGLLPRLSRPH